MEGTRAINSACISEASLVRASMVHFFKEQFDGEVESPSVLMAQDIEDFGGGKEGPDRPIVHSRGQP
eukprot:3597319-Ditylum_brightwellii.AAC.1